MRLADASETRPLRKEYRAWLAENRPADAEIAAAPPRSSCDLPAWAAAWHRRQFDAGWLVPGWPATLGGCDATASESLMCFEELSRAGLARTTNPQGLAIVVPSIVDFGTPRQIDQYARPMLRGERSACLGMSEPGAGSDLGGLATRAARDRDEFVVTGQKVWTSGAQHADYCFCFVRTDPEAPKHVGISVLLIKMDTPGVTVRPLETVIGRDHDDLNEVFFDDVRVPADNLVGQLGDGWDIANGSLAHERLMIWLTDGVANERRLSELVELFKTSEREGRPLASDEVLVDRLVRLAIDVQAFIGIGYRGYAKASRGRSAPEHALLKVFGTETRQAMELLVTDAVGPGARTRLGEGVSIDSWMNGIETAFLRYLGTFDNTISGGTSEIQRNIIAERVLGLPRR